MQTMDSDFQKQIAPRGSSLYYSLLFVSKDQRTAICAVRAFAKAVGEIIVQCSEPSVALSKFAWWRGEFQQLVSTTPTHPVSQALSIAINQYQLPVTLFQEFIEGVAQDLSCDHYENTEDLIHYHHHTAGVIERIVAHILGYSDPHTLTAVNNFGISMQIIRTMRDLRKVLSHQHCYIAQSDLKKTQLSMSQLQQFVMTREINSLLLMQAQQARHHYHLAVEQLPQIDRYNQVSILILADLYLKLLDQIVLPDSNVFNDYISLTPLRKFILSWRIHNREKNKKRISYGHNSTIKNRSTAQGI